MISSIFGLPRIVEAVARTLTCEDLLSCILVSRAWHTTWIRILWSDVITYGIFRTERGGRAYNFYFHTPEGQQALTKHAHHIRAVTCRFQRDLLILTLAGVCNLAEINYIAQELPRQRSERHRSAVIETGLSDLIHLIAQNHNLRAVSIENLGLLTADKPAEDLLALVTYLDTRPEITCFYLGGNATLDESRLDLLRTILALRLDRIDDSKVESLVLRDRQELMRNRRGPPSAAGGSAHEWPTRETPLEKLSLTCECKRSLEEPLPGRWEYDWRKHQCPMMGLAVLENKGIVEVSLPFSIFFDSIKPLMKRYTDLRRLSTGMLTPLLVRHIVGLLPETTPGLQELDVSYVEEQSLSTYLDDPRVHLSSLSVKTLLRNADTKNPFLLPDVFLKPTHFFHSALVRLDLKGIHTVMPQILQILSGSPQLQYLHAGEVHLTSNEPDSCGAPWACKGLRELRMHIHLFDVVFSGSGMDFFERQTKIADKAQMMAGPFMRQVGNLVELRELELRFYNPMENVKSPFLALSVEADNGLESLGKLNRLEIFVISGLEHQFGDKEVEWMASHWPRLRSIELPVLDGRHDPELAYPEECEAYLPDYKRCFPRLRVVIPIEVHYCRYCYHLLCDCTESSDL
ncbi:hypothetical protein BGZ52_000548 [Haplosporangium bisporale]|nr:hypothetical protein BGZ52_000548 [Haplosporangium bisporale]